MEIAEHEENAARLQSRHERELRTSGRGNRGVHHFEEAHNSRMERLNAVIDNKKAKLAALRGEPAPEGGAQTGMADSQPWQLGPAQYTKDHLAFRHSGADGWKSRGDRLAEHLGARYSNRERAYILPKEQGQELKRLLEGGYDANAVSGELVEPKGKADEPPPVEAAGEPPAADKGSRTEASTEGVKNDSGKPAEKAVGHEQQATKGRLSGKEGEYRGYKLERVLPKGKSKERGWRVDGKLMPNLKAVKEYIDKQHSPAQLSAWSSLKLPSPTALAQMSLDAAGHEHKGKGAGGGQFVSKATAAISSHAKERRGDIPVPHLYEKMKEEMPSLTPEAYKKQLVALHKSGDIRLSLWSGSLDSIPNKELAIPESMLRTPNDPRRMDYYYYAHLPQERLSLAPAAIMPDPVADAFASAEAVLHV
jgi:hypothetical protein